MSGRGSAEEIIVDSSKCYFGKWLNSYGKEKYSSFEKYSDIVEIHDELHSIGKVILDAASDRRADVFREESSNIKTKSRYLIRLLLEFANDAGKQNGIIK